MLSFVSITAIRVVWSVGVLATYTKQTALKISFMRQRKMGSALSHAPLPTESNDLVLIIRKCTFSLSLSEEDGAGGGSSS